MHDYVPCRLNHFAASRNQTAVAPRTVLESFILQDRLIGELGKS
jgi:hypothetical protein